MTGVVCSCCKKPIESDDEVFDYDGQLLHHEYCEPDNGVSNQ